MKTDEKRRKINIDLPIGFIDLAQSVATTTAICEALLACSSRIDGFLSQAHPRTSRAITKKSRREPWYVSLRESIEPIFADRPASEETAYIAGYRAAISASVAFIDAEAVFRNDNIRATAIRLPSDVRETVSSKTPIEILRNLNAYRLWRILDQEPHDDMLKLVEFFPEGLEFDEFAVNNAKRLIIRKVDGKILPSKDLGGDLSGKTVRIYIERRGFGSDQLMQVWTQYANTKRSIAAFNMGWKAAIDWVHQELNPGTFPYPGLLEPAPQTLEAKEPR